MDNTTNSVAATAGEIPVEAAPTQKIANNYFDGLTPTTTHKFVFITIMIVFFFQQMNNANFTYIAPAMVKAGEMTMATVGKITLFYFIAMTLGGLFGGIVSDFIGRRMTFLSSMFLLTSASIIDGWTHNVVLFTVARALTGFGIFSLMVCAQTYIAEMSPAESRGKWQGLVEALGFLGMPAVGILSRAIIPISPDAWRSIFYIGGLGFIPFLLALRYLPESPRWFINHKRQAEAEAVVRKLTGKNIDLTEAARRSVPQGRVKDVLAGMMQKKYQGRSLLLLVLYATSMPTGFVLFSWSGILLQAKGFSLDDCLFAALMIQLFLPIGAYLSSHVADLGGRKIPLIMALLLLAISFIGFGTASSFPLIVAFGCFGEACGTVSYSISFMYCSELYPTRMRNTAGGIQNAAGRLATAIYQPILPAIFAAAGFMGVCATNAVILLIPTVAISIWGVRTGGKSLEEID